MQNELQTVQTLIRLCQQHMLSLRTDVNDILFTPQPLFNTVHYNMVLDIRWINAGPKWSFNTDFSIYMYNRAADQCLCFPYIKRKIPLLSKSEISSL